MKEANAAQPETKLAQQSRSMTLETAKMKVDFSVWYQYTSLDGHLLTDLWHSVFCGVVQAGSVVYNYVYISISSTRRKVDWQ